MTIEERVRRGLPFDNPRIIDAHIHLGGTTLVYTPDISLEYLIKSMDRFGIEKCVISHLAALSQDITYGNREVFEAVSKYPDRLNGLAVVNPNYSKTRNLEELDNWFVESAVGIKIHPELHGYPLDGADYNFVWETAIERQSMILIHSWAGEYYRTGLVSKCGPERLWTVLERYPELQKIPIVIGHSGGIHEGYVTAAALARKYPHIYCETCGWEFSFTWFHRFVEMAGEDKIVFGSDSGLHNPAYTLGRVALSKISETAKQKILRFNMEKVLSNLKVLR